MAKKNKLVIDLGKINLTDDQRRSPHTAALHKTAAKEIKSAEKANTKKPKVIEAPGTVPILRGAAVAATGAKTANLSVTFTNTNPGDSNLTATLDTAEKELTQSGSISFKNVQRPDIILIEVDSPGSTTITIDISAQSAEMNFPPGNSGNFVIN
jgi:hypothetical protein